jgi:seryl-tRNA synthetase
MTEQEKYQKQAKDLKDKIMAREKELLDLKLQAAEVESKAAKLEALPDKVDRLLKKIEQLEKKLDSQPHINLPYIQWVKDPPYNPYHSIWTDKPLFNDVQITCGTSSNHKSIAPDIKFFNSTQLTSPGTINSAQLDVEDHYRV